MTGMGMARVSGRLALIAFIATFVALIGAAWVHNPGGHVPTLYAASGGPVDVQIDDGGGTFLFSPALCQDTMTPLSQCTASFDVSNVGDLEMQYFVTVWADADGVDSGTVGPSGDSTVACFNVNLVTGGADGVDVGNNSSEGPVNGGSLGTGDTDTWGLEASVDDTNACQGATTTVIILVTASGDALVPPVNQVDNTQQQPVNQTQPTQQQGPVNDVAGTQRVPSALPQTGSGGFMARDGLDDALLGAALAFLLSGIFLAALSRRRGDAR